MQLSQQRCQVSPSAAGVSTAPHRHRGFIGNAISLPLRGDGDDEHPCPSLQAEALLPWATPKGTNPEGLIPEGVSCPARCGNVLFPASLLLADTSPRLSASPKSLWHYLQRGTRTHSAPGIPCQCRFSASAPSASAQPGTFFPSSALPERRESAAEHPTPWVLKEESSFHHRLQPPQRTPRGRTAHGESWSCCQVSPERGET